MYNYCGPYWSDGILQRSVVGLTPPTNSLDGLCQQHDAAYAQDSNLRDADLGFARQAVKLGGLGYLFGALVGLQGLARHDINTIQDYKNNTTTMPNGKQGNNNNTAKRGNMRGSNATQRQSTTRGNASTPRATTRPNSQQTKSATTVAVSSAPASYGNTVRMRPGVSRSFRGGSNIKGVDFIGSVANTSTTTFTVAAVSPLHPAFYSGSKVGNLCKMFAKHRINRSRVHFISKTPTGVSGDVLLSTSRQVMEATLNTQSTTFLNQAMSRGNSVLSRIWENTYIDVDCDGEWRSTNPFIESDLNDSIRNELEVYINAGTASSGGYLLWEYDIDYAEQFFTPYSAFLPAIAGTTGTFRLLDAANSVALNPWRVIGGVLDDGVGNGFVYKFVVDLQGTTFGAGLTAANSLAINETVGTSTTTIGNLVAAKTVVDGMTVYGVTTGSDIVMYADLISAIAGQTDGLFTLVTTVAVQTTWSLIAYPVHFGPSITSTSN